MIQVRSERLFSYIVELSSKFLDPNEVSIIYAVRLYAKDVKDVHLRVMHIKDLCVDICPTGYF